MRKIASIILILALLGVFLASASKALLSKIDGLKKEIKALTLRIEALNKIIEQELDK